MAEWMRDYSPAGPGRMRCKLCGAVISTNALARAGHERGKRHEAAGLAKHKRERDRKLARLDAAEAVVRFYWPGPGGASVNLCLQCRRGWGQEIDQDDADLVEGGEVELAVDPCAYCPRCN